LHEGVFATDDIELAVRGSRLVFVAVPSAYFRTVLRTMLPALSKDTILVSTTKGIEAGSFLLMSQVMRQEAPDCQIGVLSGPNLAGEIARRSLTGTVIASMHESVRERVREVLKSDYFRVYTNDDMFGVELGGSLKNIYAIIAGLASAMGMGQNTNSMLITRSLTEMARFGRELGADPMTFLGLAGVGDLIVTCSSSLSRNFRVGLALGEGKPVEEAIVGIGQVAEGVNTLKQVKEKADELGVYMPLASGLYEIVYEGKPVNQVIAALMLGEGALDVEYEAHRAKQLEKGDR
jgi:glycerol-3-phosphate dehydrogenase (NAD(P)+)